MKIVNAEKKFVDDLLEECTETGSEVEMAKKTSAEYKNGCKSSSTTYILCFFLIIFRINIGIGTYFVYFHW